MQAKEALIDLIELILSDKKELEACRRSAYLHVNQFKKIVLRNLGKDVGEIRLHKWLPSDGKELDIHNHPWQFLSFVLEGTLVNTFHAELEGTDYRRTAIGPVGQGRDGYIYIADGLCSLSLLGATTLPAKGVYLLDHSLIHNAFAPSGATTLMIQGDFRREVTYAYRKTTKTRSQITHLTENEVRDTLENAKSLIVAC